jgi:hypothetical protein
MLRPVRTAHVTTKEEVDAVVAFVTIGRCYLAICRTERTVLIPRDRDRRRWPVSVSGSQRRLGQSSFAALASGRRRRDHRAIPDRTAGDLERKQRHNRLEGDREGSRSRGDHQDPRPRTEQTIRGLSLGCLWLRHSPADPSAQTKGAGVGGAVSRSSRRAASPGVAACERPPANDRPRALPRLLRVANAGEQPAQLDGGRELALLVKMARIDAASASLTTNISGSMA